MKTADITRTSQMRYLYADLLDAQRMLHRQFNISSGTLLTG